MDDPKDTLLFIDTVCPKPYHPGKLSGCGGTEMTLIDLAEGLALSGKYNVIVEQHNRMEGETYRGKATYTHQGATEKAKWVVVLRDPRPLVDARRRFEGAKIYLYSHDLADRNLGLCFSSGFFENSGCAANICVSEWHKNQTIEALKPFGYTGQFRIKYIYNPMSPDVIRTGESYDPNKLIWLASPHKGIAKAYEIFKQLVLLNPGFKLYVTNPGYMEDAYTNDPQIKNHTIVLGTIPHESAISHLRTSLCLFYPNNVFPETFGKIMAEANAVGTPVITSPIGAAREVLDSHPDQIIDCRDTESVVKMIMKWHGGARPRVRGRPQFNLNNVVTAWERLFNDTR